MIYKDRLQLKRVPGELSLSACAIGSLAVSYYLTAIGCFARDLEALVL